MLEVVPGVLQLANSFVNLYLIVEPNGLTLIDTGIARSGPKVVLEAIQRSGHQIGQLRQVLFTHSDRDHTGGAAELKQHTTTDAKFLASPHEANMMAQGLEGRPVKNPFVRTMLGLMMPKIVPQPVDGTLEAGQVLPVLGGLRVISTPGHTPGHVSFYLEQQKILFAGDSMRAENGKLSFGAGPFTWNLETGIASVCTQAKLEPEIVCCGHGPVVRGPGIVFPHS
jgi:glyoxylase-like metal-dependent hydrolase (beta-lactamase superfamily II)